MTVIGTIQEINDVLEFFNPRYPKQNLETIKTNECFYVLNQVGVNVIIQEKGEYDNERYVQ